MTKVNYSDPNLHSSTAEEQVQTPIAQQSVQSADRGVSQQEPTYQPSGASEPVTPPRQSSYGTPSYKLVQKGRRSLFAGVLLGAASGAGFFLLARGNRLVNGGYEDLRNLRMIDPENYNTGNTESPEEAYRQREEELQSQINRGENFRITGAFAGPILLIGAATALTLGAVLYAKGKNPQKFALAPSLSPNFVGASFAARF